MVVRAAASAGVTEHMCGRDGRLDVQVGVAFTRFQTRYFKGRYRENIRVLSYGPCQTPTLGFCVERHLEILRFVPEDFWSLDCELHPPPDVRARQPHPQQNNCGLTAIYLRFELPAARVIITPSRTAGRIDCELPSDVRAILRRRALRPPAAAALLAPTTSSTTHVSQALPASHASTIPTWWQTLRRLP
jgi:hypothetical protein